MRKDILILLMSLFFLNATANAGVNLSKTRVVIDKNNDYSGNVRVNNVGDEEVLIQAWIDDGTNKVKGSHFLVTPPVRRLGGKKSSTLKLDLTGLKAKQISSLEEQVYYLNVKSIPKRNNVDNKFLIATNSRIKVFVRPESLAGISSLTDVKRNLTAIQTSQGFQIINDSNFSLNFEFIEVLDVKKSGGIILPKTIKEFKTKSRPNSIKISVINDFGGREIIEIPVLGNDSKVILNEK